MLEAAATIGGGTRTEQLTRPGFLHDVCSAVHPLAVASPFLASLPLAEHGLELVHPGIPLAHPLDDGDAVALHRSVERTAAGLGADADAYRALVGPLVRDWRPLVRDLLGPLRVPRHPLPAARFAALGIRSATGLATRRFGGEAARALVAGNAAHSMQPLTGRGTAAFALVLQMLGHGVGWPVAAGGSRAITDAMASLLVSLGGEIETGRRVTSLAELEPSRAVLLDTSPRDLLAIAGPDLPRRYRRVLGRYRYGPGVFKVDYALSAPVPWTAAACRSAGTVHVGGTLAEIAEAEAEVAAGRHPRRPFVLVAQQSLFDDIAGAAGVPYPVGVLPRPQRIGHRHDRRDRAADRAVRARVRRDGDGAPCDRAGAGRGGESELRWRRHQRRSGRSPPAAGAAGGAPAARDAEPAAVPLLVLDAAGRGRPRHVRLARAPGRRCEACCAERDRKDV